MDTSKLLPALRDLDKCLQLFPRASSLDLTKPQTWEKNKEMLQHVEWISWRCMGDVEVHLASREKEKRNKHRKTGKDGVDPGAHWVRAIGEMTQSMCSIESDRGGFARVLCPFSFLYARLGPWRREVLLY
ncbi:hypothetical protein M427DRAFT_469862 [Gonapodya prolifera JEL478]|uniref:Uncharacterized protein n=1 Tax=Gonapodya prolifera (strain JEL478) TaxID=1344416 RepID=A0A139AQY7_GONPJ|nr:hypothetical protein M427DRAFT_469862 [Gonapodya prolifera JEL478]|eukprot:KXS19146.1 hypothetical protein M427DRAFT_469862 [Gonapodya prolifera JEL478]